MDGGNGKEVARKALSVDGSCRMVFPKVHHKYPGGIQDGPKIKRSRTLEKKKWREARLNIINN